MTEEASALNGVTVLLADDHAILRSGLRLLLETAGMNVAAEARTADEALRAVDEHHPDVVVLDVNMPGSSSLDTIPAMHAASPDTRVVVLTMVTETSVAREALRKGADGYLLKEAADADLLAAIRMALGGGTYLQPSLGARMAAEPLTGPIDLHDLTGRETEILKFLALGFTNTEIGRELLLSVRTVETHRTHIQRKTGRKSRSDLVRYAIEHGVLDESDLATAAPARVVPALPG